MQTQPYNTNHLNAVIRLSLRAWAPIFASLQNSMDPDVYGQFYPDWRMNQQKAIKEVCAAEDMHVWVAIEDVSLVGFLVSYLSPDTSKSYRYKEGARAQFLIQDVPALFVEL